MIPLRDTNPTKTIPFVNYILIGINIIVFFVELSVGRYMNEFIFEFGVVPARVMGDVQLKNVDLHTFIPFFSSMFLHGGWVHLLGNMLFLYIFGDNVEDKFGHLKYLIFYIVAGTAAAATQTFISPASEVPMVGASGAIAGVLGAYVLMFPTARIATLIPIFFFFQIVEIPAFIFLGLWFLMQIFSGLMALGIGADAGGVAWWAHIGGFAAGAALLPFMRRRR